MCVGVVLQNMANIESVRRNVVMINCDLFICSLMKVEEACDSDHWVLYKCIDVTAKTSGNHQRTIEREHDERQVMHILAFY